MPERTRRSWSKVTDVHYGTLAPSNAGTDRPRNQTQLNVEIKPVPPYFRARLMLSTMSSVSPCG